MTARSATLCCIAILARVLIKHDRAHAFVASPISPTASPERVPFTTYPSLLDGLHRDRALSQQIRSNVGKRHDAVILASSSLQPTSNDPRVEHRTSHKVTIDLPLGLVIEEMDSSDPSFGVAINGVNEGNAALHNSDIFAKIKSQGGITDEGSDKCICIRDKIMAVNDTPCADKGFDDVISLISSTGSGKVTLELGRIKGSTVVNYYNGICISAKAGESYGFLAEKCGIGIGYECRTGNCQTCVRWLEFPDKERDLDPNKGRGRLYERTIFHCIGRVPRGYQWLHVLDPQGGNAIKGGA